MWKDKIDKAKALIVKKEGKDNKKTIENLVVFIIILIVTILAINAIWNSTPKKAKQQEDNIVDYKRLASENDITSVTGNNQQKDELETKLESILSKINGVGEVDVLVTYSETSQVVPMYNEDSKESSTQENDTSGGSRTITQTDKSKSIIYKEESGTKVPITEKVVLPKIEGAIVIAQGAENVDTKTNIIAAVEAATGVATHKIQVFEMNR